MSRKIAVSIGDGRRDCCGNCRYLGDDWCPVWKNHLKYEYEDGMAVDAQRLPECIAAEIKKGVRDEG
jgi:hypothetical protein